MKSMKQILSLLMLVALTSCSDDDDPTPLFSIGDFYQGGVVFISMHLVTTD